MKAAVCYEFDQPLSVEDVEIDAPLQGEVVVRLAATAICHSDIHYVRGERAAAPPLVVGHEGAGIVEAVGDGVVAVQPGDRVVLSLLRSCGRCFFCQTGAPYHCEGTFALATETRLHNARGEPLWDGELGCSAFAELAVVDQSQLVRLPDEIGFDCGCLLACGVITGLGAVVRTAGMEPGALAVVIGCGGVGLNAIQGARIAGARRIVAVDTVQMKLEAAALFGATDMVNASTSNARETVLELTGGRGADYVFVAAGSRQAATEGLAMTRTAGTLVLVGLPGPGVEMPIVIRDVGWRGQRILGSCMGSTRLSVDVPWLLDLYAQGRLMLDELITARYPLADINHAIGEVERGEALRNVIVFDGGSDRARF